MANNTVLFCQTCKEDISVKKSVIKGHTASKKHSANKKKLAKAKKREMDIAEALDKEHHPKGETLPTATRVYRVKIVQAFLNSGTPLWLSRLEYSRSRCDPHFSVKHARAYPFHPRRGVQIYCQRTTGKRMYQLYLMER